MNILLARAIVATVVLASTFVSTFSTAQQNLVPPEIPDNFRLDMETAARLRGQLMALSFAAARRYPAAGLVLDRLVGQGRLAGSNGLAWQLRIIENDEFNAYSSPDGTIYVESGLASIAGASAGLWAAILSHEISHVIRRDWARRYLYQKSQENGSDAAIVLGDPALPAADWTSPQEASQKMAQFCRRLEVEADHEGLLLMARTGYHPDFVPALHHLLHAHDSMSATSLFAMHPCWEERDRELSRAYVAASIEFEHLWPEWYASPGGNPPIVVFADEPRVRRTATKDWEVQIPMRCQNLAGAVEVVLHSGPSGERKSRRERPPESESGGWYEVRQLTGCTSPRTTITFSLADAALRQKPGAQWTEVYILDTLGSVLTRADLPRRSH